MEGQCLGRMRAKAAERAERGLAAAGAHFAAFRCFSLSLSKAVRHAGFFVPPPAHPRTPSFSLCPRSKRSTPQRWFATCGSCSWALVSRDPVRLLPPVPAADICCRRRRKRRRKTSWATERRRAVSSGQTVNSFQARGSLMAKRRVPQCAISHQVVIFHTKCDTSTEGE